MRVMRISVGLCQLFPVGRIDMGLAQNTPQCADRHLLLLRNDRGIDDIAGTSYKLHIAGLLACFHATGSLKSALDFPEGQRIQLRQPQPRSCGPLALAWPAGARNGVPALLSNWPAPLVRSDPDWRCQFPSTVSRTNCRSATRSQ